MEGPRTALGRRGVVAFAGCICRDAGEQTFRLAGLCGPVQAVPLALRADQSLCVDAFPVGGLASVILLRNDEPAAELDRVELVPPDATADQLFPARGGIEEPSLRCFDEWNWERPRVGADLEK